MGKFIIYLLIINFNSLLILAEYKIILATSTMKREGQSLCSLVLAAKQDYKLKNKQMIKMMQKNEKRKNPNFFLFVGMLQLC